MRAWHHELGSQKMHFENKQFIFLLKGDKLERTYPGFFIRDLSERAEIENLIKKGGAG